MLLLTDDLDQVSHPPGKGGHRSHHPVQVASASALPGNPASHPDLPVGHHPSTPDHRLICEGTDRPRVGRPSGQKP